MPDFSAIKALTFDCYGTLVDWESGILGAVRPVLARRGVRAADADLLSQYARAEAEEEAGEYRPYREVLARVMTGLAAANGVSDLSAAERNCLAESLPRWPVFSDTTAFLRRAGARYTLAVCSNIDDDLFAHTHAALGVRLDWVVTAQYCRSYKPAPRHFRVALALLGLEPGQVLHVAESRRHDIAPARAMGFRTAWVNRHQGRPGPSASGEWDSAPDVEVADLATLGELLGMGA